MAISHYRDFVLVADDVKKNRDGIVSTFTVCVFDSPVGQGEQKERVTVPDDLVKQIRWLETGRLDEDVEKQIALGELLAGLLLPTYARRLFGESLKRLRDGEGLRLRLRLADELADFPWEYMYIQDTRGERTSSSFLALDPRISIVRHEALAVPGDWFEAQASRRIVVAMATPQPYARYSRLDSLPHEQQLLKAALAEVPGTKAVFLPEQVVVQGDQITGATLEDVMMALTERTDILHFSGHGDFRGDFGIAKGSEIGAGGIVLAGEKNQAFLVAADRFAEVLRGKGIRLVVLGACETGRRDGHNIWSGVAAALLKAGIPAVVAMQFTIHDDLAAEFCGAFYRGLVAGFTVDEAVSLGRAAIRAKALHTTPDTRDWGVPVLYLRAAEGRIFNPVSDEHARQAAEREVEHLVTQQVREITKEGRIVGPVVGSLLADTLRIEQKVTEEVKGFLLGPTVYSVQGGRLVITQTADSVSGKMCGGYIESIGGPAAQPPSNGTQALTCLERSLRLGSAPTPTIESAAPTPPADALLTNITAPSASLAPVEQLCPSCQRPIEPGAKFCSSCGTAIAAGPAYCASCGAELPAGAKFCTRCGHKVG